MYPRYPGLLRYSSFFYRTSAVGAGLLPFIHFPGSFHSSSLAGKDSGSRTTGIAGTGTYTVHAYSYYLPTYVLGRYIYAYADQLHRPS
ncbi:hypothetical protein GGS23DRAFT_147045 [Durotheca rogersii]|uniref:uncharacterized protein n=1 Tax=Durotheca rogersii TaxID=419775 RepID=UPI00221FE961|nr:uncharacterized protein GGS23DRAFT_147045 [Durotheca rogersii]KAI5861335.1 hypothetical protein GGS23DRAFT_147045 [Durotheca rogersii]